MQQRQIKEIVDLSKKYTSPADFLKSAVEILLAWESNHPEDCLQLINSLRPFTREQELTMKMNMPKDAIEKHFGVLDSDSDIKEHMEQKTLAQTDYDHMKLQGNYSNTIKYIKTLKISTPKNIIPYDEYPVLSSNYGRFLPVKLTISMLAHLLESKKSSKIELRELRIHAFDLLEEYGKMIRKYEKENDIPRNKKLSTGLPNKSKNYDDEKEIESKIRMKDVQIGKIKKSRSFGGKHFEGALSALGLVYAFEENDKEFISLSELGKKFILIENPVFPKNDFSSGALSTLETDFIMREIIPQRELEKQIVDKVMWTLKGLQKSKEDKRDSKKDLAELESEIYTTIKAYVNKNPDASLRYNMSNLVTNNEKTKRKIKQRRLATMGRLVEMQKVKWEINENSISEYSTI